MADFNKIAEKVQKEDDNFYASRGLKIHSLEVSGYRSPDYIIYIIYVYICMYIYYIYMYSNTHTHTHITCGPKICQACR
jgi:hypothetical protein